MSKSVLTSQEYSPAKIKKLINLAIDIKKCPEYYQKSLNNKSFVLLFEKPSLRTRASFEIGIHKMGGQAIFFDQQHDKLGRREAVADVAKNIACWADGVIARVDKHETLQEFSKATNMPVLNALCDTYHPCQALADFMTLKEQGFDFKKLHFAYVGDGNNVCHSLMLLAAMLGSMMTVVAPKGHQPEKSIIAKIEKLSAKSKGSILVTDDVAALEGVDVIYTDTWVSMGNEQASDQQDVFAYLQVNQQLMQKSGAQYFMHCQPAHREVEVTSEVLDSEQSLIFQQAENRMWVQNAILHDWFH